MKMTLKVFCLCLILLVSTSFNFLKKQYYEYKLIVLNDMLFLPIKFNGKNTKLLVDTGASKSILNIRKIEQYEFSYVDVPFKQYVGIGGIEDIFIVFDYEVDELFIEFLGADLGEIDDFMRNDGISIIGILGSDFMLKHKAILNYRTKKLYIKR